MLGNWREATAGEGRLTQRVGIVGAGQLARMMCQAAIPLGIETVVLANTLDESAAQVCANVVLGSPDNFADLQKLAKRVDVVTFDHELVDPEHLEMLVRGGHTLRPGPETLAIAVDKLRQRTVFSEAGLPVPAWQEAATPERAVAFGNAHGWPMVVKAARGGYDGRGVWICDTEGDARALLQAHPGDRFLCEAFVPIDMELAVLVATSANGERRNYPVVESTQRDGVCCEVYAPARIEPAIAEEAERIGLAVAEVVGSIGNLAIELFVANGKVLINEIAARPHNSGHFSIEGAVASQFENHLRGVLGWPLGSTELAHPAATMINVFGHEGLPEPADAIPSALEVSGAHVHWYGKGSRPGRKLGHVTAVGADLDDTTTIAKRAAARLGEQEG